MSECYACHDEATKRLPGPKGRLVCIDCWEELVMGVIPPQQHPTYPNQHRSIQMTHDVPRKDFSVGRSPMGYSEQLGRPAKHWTSMDGSCEMLSAGDDW